MAPSQREENDKLWFDLCPEGLTILDGQGRVTTCNPAFCEMVDKAENALLDRPLESVFDKVDGEAASRIGALPRSHAKAPYRFQWQRPDGRACWLEVTARPIVQRRRRTGTLCVWRDLGAAGEAESQANELRHRLEESEANLRQLTENIGDVFYISDWDTKRFLYVSPAYEALWGQSVDEVLVRPRAFFDAIHPDDRDAVDEAIRREREEGTLVDHVFRILRRDGGLHWIHAKHFPIHDAHGRIYRVAGVAVDITERRRADRLAQSQIRLSEIAQSQSMTALMQAFLDEAELLTGSQIGFFHSVDPDQEHLTLQAWSTRTVREMCQMQAQGMHYALDQAGVWVEAARLRRPVVHNDYATLPHRKGLPEGHAPVVRELVVPVIRGEMILAVLGVGNKPVNYDVEDEKILSTLADMAWDMVQRKTAESQLKTTRDFYEAVLEGVHDGIWVTDEKDVITFCNRGMEGISGVSRNQIIGRRIPDDFPNETVTEFYPYYRQVKAVEEPIPYEATIKTPAGRESIQEGWLIPRRTIEGVQGIICTIRDVTDERQRASALRESQRRLHTLMDNLPGMAYRCLNDAQWTMELVSQGCLRLTGYAPGALMGNRQVAYNDLIHPEDRQLVRNAVQAGINNREPFLVEYRIRDRQGQTKWVWEQGVAVYDDAQQLTALEGFITDITGRREAMEALRKSEEKHRRLFETMSQGVVYQAADGQIISANPAAESILGLTLDQLQGKTSMDPQWKMILEDGSEVPGSEHPAMLALRTGKKFGPAIRGVFHPQRKSHSWLSITAIPLFLPGQTRPFQVYTTFDDITEQRRAEENYRTLFREMLDGFAVHEILCNEAGEPVDYRFLAVNPAFERMTGLKAEDILGHTVLEVLPGTERHWIETYGKVALTGEPAFFENHAAELKKYFQVTAFQPVPHQFACIFADVTERREFEQALRQSEQEYKRLFHEALTGNYISDSDGRILLCNDTFARLTGYASPLEIYDLPAESFYAAPEKRREMVRLLKKKKNLRQVENRIRRKDGSFITVLENVTGTFDGKGRLSQIKGYLIDISDRKAAETALEQSEAKYRHLFDNAPIGILSVDDQGNILEVNDRLVQILGSPSAEETRKINVFTFPSLVHAGVSEVFKACLHTGEDADHEHHYISKWGKESDLSYHLVPIRDREDRVTGVQATVQDITRRKKAERKLLASYQELKENQKAALNLMEDLTLENQERRRAETQLSEYAAKLDSLLAAAPIGIGLLVDRVFQQVNATMCVMTGYGEGELLGQSARMLYPSDEEFRRVGEDKYAQIAQWGTGTVETQWLTKTGEVLDILLSSTPVNPRDWSVGVTFTALDITERKRSETKIKDSLREKEMLLKEIHHRVKNNLQIINSLLNLQTMQTQDSTLITALQESRDRIYSMALVHERLYRSTDFSSISFADYIRTVIRELFSSYEITSRIQLKLDVDAIDLGIDAAIPCGLLVNELITNALKHAFPDGRSGVVRVRFDRRPEGLLCLTVSDNGVGIPKGTDLSGKSSLGMQLVRVLTEQLEGHCKIVRRRGTSFEICFPEPEKDLERRRMGTLPD